MKKSLMMVAMAVMSMSAMASDMYVSGSLGQSKLHNVDTTGLTSFDSKDQGFAVAFGATVMPHLAVEVGYNKFGTFAGNAGEPFEVKGSAYQASVVGSFEVMPQTDVFGRLGVIRSTASSQGESEKKTSVLYGLGTSYQMTPELSATLEYQYVPKVAVTNEAMSSINVGLKYGF